jgi:hypothetical protein
MTDITGVITEYTDGKGKWAQALDEGLAIVTSKYNLAFQGMRTTGMNTIADGLKDLEKLYKKYFDLKAKIEGTGSGGGGGGGDSGIGAVGDGSTGNLPGSGEASAANKRLMENIIDSSQSRFSVKRSLTPQFHAQVAAIKQIVNGTWNAQNKEKDRYIVRWSSPNGQVTGKFTPLSLIESAWFTAKNIGGMSQSDFKNSIGGAAVYNSFNMKHRINPELKRYGGFVKGAMSQSVPALLHGGEFVISAGAVNKMGIGALEQINNMRFANPNTAQPKVISENYSTQNVNIYVDNFIGQDQWFESMMKEYNIKVVPRNQKAAGLENRVIRSYNGINRGM